MTCFHLGFDVLIIDHRGQGRSGRLLADPHLGHVNRFNDYVDDLAAFWQQEVQPVRGVNAIYWHIRWAVRSPHYFCNAIQVYVTPLR